MAAPKPKQGQESFEELYQQLELKVSLLEQGGLSLDDSLSAYEEAVALAQKCQQLLDGAELRITRLKESIAVSEAAGAYEAYGDEEEEGEA
ncbi:MAG: exodeoxyribonuclease VII small subunit [Dehalococcoidia bacterium]|nr:exodeoxyribonuclease VII small subunit [Dehalococcoidia bacterium]